MTESTFLRGNGEDEWREAIAVWVAVTRAFRLAELDFREQHGRTPNYENLLISGGFANNKVLIEISEELKATTA